MRVYDALGQEKSGQEARYASIYVNDGSTAQGSISTTPAKVTGFAANGPSNDATPDHTNDQITIGTAGTYRVTFSISFSGTVSTEFTFKLRNNAVEQAMGCIRTLGTGGDSGSASFAGLITLSASDVLTVYVEADGASKSITPEDMHLSVTEIAPATSSGGGDADAIHVNVSGEIAGLTEKVSPVGADKIVIEDSAASDGKKYVQITNLPAGSETNNLAGDGISGIADDQLVVGTGAGTAAYQTLPNGAVSYATAGGTFSQAASGDLSDGASLVANDQGNTYSTGAQDFSAATSMTVPVAAGAAPTANGTVAYDSTANALEYGDNGTTRTVVNTDEAQTLTSKTLTTPSIGDLTNATHTHQNAAGGGSLDAAAIGTGTFAVGRGGTGRTSFNADSILTTDGLGQLNAGISTPSGDIVGTTETQTLSSKTLTAPTIGAADWTNATHSHQAAASGGTLSHNNATDNPSSGVHGVTGSVVGTTDTQTLTNKDLSGTTTKLRQYATKSLEDPTNAEDRTLWFFDRAVTAIQVRAVVVGSTPSVTYQLKHSTDRSAAGNNLTTSGAVTNTTTGADATLSDATIPANSWVWLETTATSGTVDEIAFFLEYTED